MAERAVYLGPRIRRLRRNLGLTQSAVASDLGISASYVALIESNQRPLTADLLLRFARTYKVDMSEIAGDGGADLAQRFQAVLRDPMFGDLDMPALQDVDVATNYPAVAEAFLRLHTAHREEQLALADRDASLANSFTRDPIIEVRQFLAARQNYFPTLEDAAERLSSAIAASKGVETYLDAVRGLRVRSITRSDMMLRRYDPHHRAVFLNARLDRASRQFQLIQQVVHLELSDLLDRLVKEAPNLSENGRKLARRSLAAYAAAAVLMPYRSFRAAAEDMRYDLEALGRQFSVSFEQVAHRLTTLQGPNDSGIPFFFIRVDPAGNVSKRLDGAGFPFARHGGACPLWNLHSVFLTPGEIVTQVLELPDGQRFFSIARTVTAGGGAWGAVRVPRAVAICCAADQANKLVYADTLSSNSATPIGIGCGLCHREDCAARAVPPLGRALLRDDYHRSLAPFGFGDG